MSERPHVDPIRAGTLPERPRPAGVYPAYWQALREHRLVVQRCSGCGKLRHYPRPLCDTCFSFDHEWVELSGRGIVHSWTVSHHPFHPAFKRDVPYTMLTVDLEEGVRLQAPLAGGAPDTPGIGAPVQVAYLDVDDELTLPCFRPCGDGSG